MSASERPDSRVFASYPMPAKIDLINERPRRESQVERQLEDRIGQISPLAPLDNVPRITVTEQQNTSITTGNTSFGQQQQHYQEQQSWPEISDHQILEHQTRGRHQEDRPTSRCEVKETRIIINQHSAPITTGDNFERERHFGHHQSVRAIDESSFKQQSSVLNQEHQQASSNHQTTTTNNSPSQQLPSLNMALNRTISNNKAVLAAELAEKEAKLLREISALHQRPYSPYQTPAKIDLTSEQWNSQQQSRNAPDPASRPNSRASNKSINTGQDLLEKEARLLREIEEIESKPYNPQTMIVEREQWFEYPENRPQERHLTESKRRVRDFCSMPPGLCQDRHIHEENLHPRPGQVTATPESIHTTIIRSPKREIDNKSPLPFAFDNFTTKGVRGNIASVGAVEPDRPRPPIFPIVKRSPSPNVARG